MKSAFLNNQIINAKDNFNYFFMKLIAVILQNLLKISIVLLFNQIFNYLIINMLSIIIIVYFMYNIYNIIDNYSKILNDIKDTLPNENIFYEIDLNILADSLFKRKVKYGK